MAAISLASGRCGRVLHSPNGYNDSPDDSHGYCEYSQSRDGCKFTGDAREQDPEPDRPDATGVDLGTSPLPRLETPRQLMVRIAQARLGLPYYRAQRSIAFFDVFADVGISSKEQVYLLMQQLDLV